MGRHPEAAARGLCGGGARGRADRRALSEVRARRPRPSRRARRRAMKVERAGRAMAVVHVTGAVRRPGVYRLPSWARLDAAVRQAGGATPSADLRGREPRGQGGRRPAGDRAARVARAAPQRAPGSAAAPAPRRPVSLNTATPSSSTSSTASVPPPRRRSSTGARSTVASGRSTTSSRSAASGRSASRR